MLRSDRKQAEQAQTFAQPSAQPTTTARCDNPMELPRVHRRPELVPAAARAAEPRPAARPELVPTAPAAAAARPSRRAAVCCTRQRADLSFDLVTAGVSLADIVTDILVARAFYLEDHFAFFVVAAALLVVAQLSYAFMFAATYAGKRRPAGQLAVFLCALPFGQLVPIFTWIESLQLAPLTRAMRAAKLTPSADAETQAGRGAAEADELWSAIQSKYRSHSGFLLEAIVEAVPQGLLQTVFIVVYGELTFLNALSLTFSLVVVSASQSATAPKPV